MSLVASILTNRYKAMARDPFQMNLGLFCVISEKGSDDFGIHHSGSYNFIMEIKDNFQDR